MFHECSQPRANPASRRPAGFTLIEVLLVLVILVVLSSIAVPIYQGILGAARVKAAKVQVHMLDKAVELYYVDISKPPAELNDLLVRPADAKVSRHWGGPYLKKGSELIDPWEDPYEYAAQGTRNAGSYDVWSLGPDTQNGTADDIGNWPE